MISHSWDVCEADVQRPAYLRGQANKKRVMPRTGEPLISIVDDDQAMRSALVRLIRSLGFVARGFASAEEFIGAGVMPVCSCVVTDIQMPGMSGFHLTRLIAERHSQIPVILITARTEPGLEEVALASGAVAFFRKPIDTTAFVECLEMVMGA